ncbi:KTI12-like protein [Mya arenaria]|uniref:Protein KTI12 homolog n=1 Tax=Mya arenaria TaxID=6604 RepID=A0ABY7G4K9_MYAAR|nr:KTI12-like protein [Mya arenaria]
MPDDEIFCDTNRDVASEWNMARPDEERYSQDIFDGLVQRFEEPKANNRWDSPLFVVQKDDALPFEAIVDALLRRKAPPPNASTLPQPLSSTNFLYELDKTTQDILGVIMESQKTSVPGDNIGIPGATDKLQFTRSFTLAELQRTRRQFITYMKMHPVDNPGKISNMFVQYLNNTLK